MRAWDQAQWPWNCQSLEVGKRLQLPEGSCFSNLGCSSNPGFEGLDRPWLVVVVVSCCSCPLKCRNLYLSGKPLKYQAGSAAVQLSLVLVLCCVLLAMRNFYFQWLLACLSAENANSPALWAALTSAFQVDYPYVVLSSTYGLVSQRNPIKIAPHCLHCMQLWLCLCPGLVLLTNSCYFLWTGFTQHRQSTRVVTACIGCVGSAGCWVPDLIPKLAFGIRNEFLEEVGSLGWSVPCFICFKNKQSNLTGDRWNINFYFSMETSHREEVKY